MGTILEGTNDPIGRFLTVFRYNNTTVERAHRLLGFYYYASGRHIQAAEHLMFAFLIQNTIMIEEILRNQYDFVFTNLDALMDEVMRRQILIDYKKEVEYYKTLYYFASALYASGSTKRTAARQIWEFLARRPEAKEWGGRARLQLRAPYIEQIRGTDLPSFVK